MAHGRLVRTEIARLGLSKVVSFATRAANNISTTLSSLHPSRKIFHGRVSSAAPAPLNSATPNNFLQRPSFQPAETAPNSRLGSSLDKSTDNSLKCLGNQLNKLKRLHYESIEISDHISILKQEIASNEELLLKLSENKDSSADQSFLEELGIDKDRLADFKHYV